MVRCPGLWVAINILPHPNKNNFLICSLAALIIDMRDKERKKKRYIFIAYIQEDSWPKL